MLSWQYESPLRPCIRLLGLIGDGLGGGHLLSVCDAKWLSPLSVELVLPLRLLMVTPGSQLLLS